MRILSAIILSLFCAGAWAAFPTTNLQLLLRADTGCYTDAGTTAANDGDLVYRWADQSGNANHANQTTSGNRPTLRTNWWGKNPALYFTTDNYLTIAHDLGLTPVAEEFHVYVVFYSETWAATGVIINKGQESSIHEGWSIMQSNTTETNIVRCNASDDSSQRASQTSARVVGGPNLLEMHISGGEITGYSAPNTTWSDGGGGPAGNTFEGTIDGADVVEIGRDNSPGNYLEGYVSLIAIYKGAHDQAAVRAELADWCQMEEAVSAFSTPVEVAATTTTTGPWNRLPTIAKAGNGNLICLYEKRNTSNADLANNIDIAYKISDDNGATWGSESILKDAGANRAGNPCAVADSSGTVHVLYGYDSDGDADSGDTCGYQYSEDGGATWSGETDVSASVLPPGMDRAFCNPSTGVLCDSGRLVFPSRAYDTDLSPNYRQMSIYTDDAGTTWNYGGYVPYPGGIEGSIAKLPDGKLMWVIRLGVIEDASLLTHQFIAISEDEGVTWERTGVAYDWLMTEVHLGLCLVGSTLVSSGLNVQDTESPTLAARRGIILRSCASPTVWDRRSVLYAQKAGYSNLIALDQNTVAIIWERGDEPHVYTNSEADIYFTTATIVQNNFSLGAGGSGIIWWN